MTSRHAIMLPAVAVLTLTSALLAGPPPVRAVPAAGATHGIRQRLAAAVSAERRQLGIPGVTVLAASPELGLWTGTFGAADRATGRRMAVDDHFRIASVTKTFTATVVLQLVAAHRLSLSDHLARWVPIIPYARQITVRELLNHTSGIRDYEDNPELLDAVAHQPLRVWTPRQLVRYALYKPPLFPPGARWSYSNTNYLLLGMIVQQITHRPLGYEIRTRISRPLSLHQTRFPLVTPDLPRPFSHGYAPAGIVGPPLYPVVDHTRWSPSWDFAAGNMVSTAPDLLVWARALGKGTLLTPAMRRAQRTWVKAGGVASYGLGLGRFPVDGVFFLGHDGADPGYSTAIAYAPALRLSIVVLANRCCDRSYTNAITKTVASMIIRWERSRRPVTP